MHRYIVGNERELDSVKRRRIVVAAKLSRPTHAAAIKKILMCYRDINA